MIVIHGELRRVKLQTKNEGATFINDTWSWNSIRITRRALAVGVNNDTKSPALT